MNARWIINRLKAMTIAEVLHRGSRLFTLYAEKWAVMMGWEPNARHSEPGHSDALFPCSIDETMISSDLESLSESLRSGHVDLFDYQHLQTGNPVQWHVDPLTLTQIDSKAFGKTLNYRDSRQVGDVKVIWELGRHQFLVPIAIEFLVEKDDEHLDVIANVLSSWLDQNPYGKGIHWCSSLEVALRGISWAVTHQILRAAGLEHGLFSLKLDNITLKKSLYQHAWFTRHYLSQFSSANNHLIGELTGLLVLTTVFPFGNETNKWRVFAWQKIQRQALDQVWPDGVNKEQAIYYHSWVLEYFIIAYTTATRSGISVPRSFVDVIYAMADFLATLCPSFDGRDLPQVGDADDGVALRFSEAKKTNYYTDLIASAAHIAGLTACPSQSTKALWYASLGAVRSEHKAASLFARQYPKIFTEGGYAVLGSENLHLLFDAGPIGYPSIAAHGHADALSFCLAIDKEWWLVDPGTYAYHAEEQWRNYFRGTAAHNTVLINNENQSQIGGAFLWLDRAEVDFEGLVETADPCEQSCSGSVRKYFRSPDVAVTRTVRINPKASTIFLADQITCSCPTDVSLCFHFAPHINVEVYDENRCKASIAGGSKAMHLTFSSTCSLATYCGSENPIWGWYSGSLGKKEPCITLVASTRLYDSTKLNTKIDILAI
ncbi:MAG: alginate lyase family protein [Halioglobus sp.]|nr:alginate lyase family protein [Halioglobus sp.]